MACSQHGLIAAQKCANIRQCSEKRAGSFAFAHSPAQLAQMVGFEPTEHVTAQTISSRSRYGHFDTSANLSFIGFYYIRILEKMQVLFSLFPTFLSSPPRRLDSAGASGVKCSPEGDAGYG